MERGRRHLHKLPRYCHPGNIAVVPTPTSSREEAHPSQFPLCGGHRFILDYNLCGQSKDDTFICLWLHEPFSWAPIRERGKWTNCPVLSLDDLTVPWGGVKTLYDKNVPSVRDTPSTPSSSPLGLFWHVQGGEDTNEVTASRADWRSLHARSSTSWSPGWCWPGSHLLCWPWQLKSAVGGILSLVLHLGRPQGPDSGFNLCSGATSSPGTCLKEAFLSQTLGGF